MIDIFLQLTKITASWTCIMLVVSCTTAATHPLPDETGEQTGIGTAASAWVQPGDAADTGPTSTGAGTCRSLISTVAIIDDAGQMSSEERNRVSKHIGIQPSAIAELVAQKIGCFDVRDAAIAMAGDNTKPDYILEVGVIGITTRAPATETAKRVGQSAAAAVGAILGPYGPLISAVGQLAPDNDRPDFVTGVSVSVSVVCADNGKFVTRIDGHASQVDVNASSITHDDARSSAHHDDADDSMQTATDPPGRRQAREILAQAFYKAFEASGHAIAHHSCA